MNRHATKQAQKVDRSGTLMVRFKSALELVHYTQNIRLSKSLQMHCHQDNFMVVNQKVVKVVRINRLIDNLIELIVVSAITF